MAPNQWWMSPLGSDANDGTKGSPKLTIAGIMALSGLVTGDIVNVIADKGTYVWPQSATPTTVKAGTKGTGFTPTTWGLCIRGTDSDGYPRIARFAPSGGNGVRSFLQAVANSGYVVVRNLRFDASGFEADTNAYDCFEYNDNGSPDPGGFQFEGCSFAGAGLGTLQLGTRRFIRLVTGASVSGFDYFRCVGCYFQNAILGVNGNGIANKSFDHCLFYYDSDDSPSAWYTQTLSATSPSAALSIVNCTVYMSLGLNSTGQHPFVFNVSGATTDYGVVTSQSNLVFINGTSASIQVRFMGDSSAPGTETGVRNIGNNLLYGGKDVTSGEKHAAGWYQNEWDPDRNDGTGVDPYATDVEEFGQYEAQVFAYPERTYAWDPLGNGAQIILPKDLRPIKNLTVGVGGTVPGALPAFVPEALDWFRRLPEVPVVENLSWLTSVVTADDGSDEQRMALRMQPRRKLELAFVLEDEGARRDEYRRLHSAPNGKLRLPLYPYATPLTAASTVGTLRLFFDPTKTDVRAFEYVLIYRPNTEESFLVKLGALQSDGADTLLPLAQGHVVTDFLIPTVEGYFADNEGLTMGAMVGVERVNITAANARTSYTRPGSAAVIATFDSLNVLDRRPLVPGEVPEQFARNPLILDNETGFYEERVSWLHPFVAGGRQFLARRTSTTDMDFWRDFLQAVRGMREPFLAPTFREDFLLAAIPSSSSTTIDVFTADYSTVYFPRDTYKRLRLEAPNGEVIYRKVSSVLVLSSTTQRLTLNTALPGTSAWANGFKVGYLNRVRLGADDVRMIHGQMDTMVELVLRTTDT